MCLYELRQGIPKSAHTESEVFQRFIDYIRGSIIAVIAT
jgi:hypothetical protein